MDFVFFSPPLIDTSMCLDCLKSSFAISLNRYASNLFHTEQANEASKLAAVEKMCSSIQKTRHLHADK